MSQSAFELQLRGAVSGRAQVVAWCSPNCRRGSAHLAHCTAETHTNAPPALLARFPLTWHTAGSGTFRCSIGCYGSRVPACFALAHTRTGSLQQRLAPAASAPAISACGGAAPLVLAKNDSGPPSHSQAWPAGQSESSSLLRTGGRSGGQATHGGSTRGFGTHCMRCHAGQTMWVPGDPETRTRS